MNNSTPSSYFPDNLQDYAPWVARYGLTAPYGMCQCEQCGQPAPISKGDVALRGYRANHPKRFISGHATKRPIAERFWEKVDKDGPIHPVLGTACWLWTASLHTKGYGQIFFDGKMTKAHRVSWVLHNGPIPDDLHTLHHCDVRACVRIDHIFLGTNAENNADMYAKGRGINLSGSANGKAVLTEQLIPIIRQRAAEGATPDAIAEECGASIHAIKHVLRGNTWRHVV